MKSIDVKKIVDEYDKVRLALLAYWTGKMAKEEARMMFLEDPDMAEGFGRIIAYYEKSRLKMTDKLNKVEAVEDKNQQCFVPRLAEYLTAFLKGTFWENKELPVYFGKKSLSPTGVST